MHSRSFPHPTSLEVFHLWHFHSRYSINGLHSFWKCLLLLFIIFTYWLIHSYCICGSRYYLAI